jgi:NAD(P)-dependent dehydrogenase (short-subunit alcohol dehydrogenase family)
MVLSLDRWVGKVAVVTGCASGIGAGIAEFLVDQGLIVRDPTPQNSNTWKFPGGGSGPSLRTGPRTGQEALREEGTTPRGQSRRQQRRRGRGGVQMGGGQPGTRPHPDQQRRCS